MRREYAVITVSETWGENSARGTVRSLHRTTEAARRKVRSGNVVIEVSWRCGYGAAHTAAGRVQ